MLTPLARCFGILSMLAVLAGPSGALAQSMPVTFSDASSQLDFEHRSSEFGGNGLVGAAWFDYDEDGLLDLFIPNGKDQPNGLFRNLGDGVFANVADAAGVENGLGNAAVLAADFNNDGWSDLFLTGEQGRGLGWFQSPAKIYRNNGDGTFTDVTAQSGIVGPAAHRTASAADVNNDGLLDLLIAGNTSTSIQPNKLYLNNGDFGFTDISASSGLNTLQSTCASLFSDYNGDGFQDLFMAPCTTQTPLDLYRNNGDLTFTDVGVQSGLFTNALFMGLCGADYDHDGDIDVFATNYASTSGLPHALYRNNGNGTFTDVAVAAGVAFHEFGWGCSFTDFDNDGFDDLFFTGSLDTTCLVTSGCPDFETIGEGRGNPGTMLFSNGDGTFTEFTEQMPVDMRDLYTSGVAHADYDQNGFSDILIATETVPAQHGRPKTSGRPILYSNEGNANNWITLRLRGTTSNRDAIGARVQVHAGDLVQTKEVYAGSSHLTTESAWMTFGVASQAQIDQVVVRWPSGVEDVFTPVPINALTVLVEGMATSIETKDPVEIPSVVTLHPNFPNPFSEFTMVEVELRETRPVSLLLYDVFGRRVKSLMEGTFAAGVHRVTVQASEVASGLYMYRLQVGSETRTGTMLVVK